MKFIKEFKKFAVKGNMFEMAVGIIVGTAFNRIVTSLVKDIITPFFGVWLGDAPFQELKWVLKPEVRDASGVVTEAMVSVNYGAFIQTTLDFFIISLSIFVVIKTYNVLLERSNDEKDNSVPTPKDIQLLSEIRDLLKKD